jgi:hypothetical protein
LLFARQGANGVSGLDAMAGGNLHRMETTARLTMLDAGGGCAAKYAAGRL